ncbi:heptaprenylglyceryl phosphate synthase [Pseudalkalibacillus berkeleyi]|uniref:Heptaprenylglyceryl phosphate synthase n=1 Tax=Pseudalkalibacillus berkeleyi TaxID=1069813 RepID=A0ABS9H5T7_9BACL|nr:heptaprenylglyceryl phosphate synthase [Pseudalkalibacillus berkeleyi]MCF6139148.1 heptaprenylglyceryl phosphate synthase [Pseudalkalibacillus berkeleyi]
MFEYQEWKHVFKLDPNKEITPEALDQICESGTDAVIVGGSDGVTIENTVDLLSRIRKHTVPCVLEISNIESITPGFDYYFVPSVLNSQNPDWIVGLHKKAIKEYGHLINWDELVTEGYCIVNPDSKAAKLSEAEADLDNEDVLAYAKMAEHMFRLPIFYLEYSGTYGELDLVKDVSTVLNKTSFFYGGGIKDKEQARTMAQFADTIVVGNIIYEDLEAAISTVKVVKG